MKCRHNCYLHQYVLVEKSIDLLVFRRYHHFKRVPFGWVMLLIFASSN